MNRLFQLLRKHTWLRVIAFLLSPLWMMPLVIGILCSYAVYVCWKDFSASLGVKDQQP